MHLLQVNDSFPKNIFNSRIIWSNVSNWVRSCLKLVTTLEYVCYRNQSCERTKYMLNFCIETQCLYEYYYLQHIYWNDIHTTFQKVSTLYKKAFVQIYNVNTSSILTSRKCTAVILLSLNREYLFLTTGKIISLYS